MIRMEREAERRKMAERAWLGFDTAQHAEGNAGDIAPL
jgi:hypothetical protein